MPEKKANTPPITITFSINPAMKVNAQGQRCMAVSVVAKQGEMGQVSQFDMTNWKADIAAEVDRVMRLLMSGSLNLPEFPNMNEAAAAPAPVDEAADEGEEGFEDEAAEDNTALLDGEDQSDGSLDDYADYEMTLYEPENDGAGSQGTLL